MMARIDQLQICAIVSSRHDKCFEPEAIPQLLSHALGVILFPHQLDIVNKLRREGDLFNARKMISAQVE